MYLPCLRDSRLPSPPPRTQQSRRAVIDALVSSALGRPVAELRAATRRAAPTAFARQCAMYLAHVVMGLNYSEIGRVFGRDRTTAAHACRLVEERRDDPQVDALLGGLETACRFALSRSSGAGEAHR